MFRTQAQVDKLRAPEGKADSYVWDDEQPGLSIRFKGGKRSYVVWYSAGNKRRKLTLGATVGLTLKEARQQAARIIADARDGRDVQDERARVQVRAADRLGALIEIYLERRARPRQRPRALAETVRYLTRYWAPLHGRQVDDIGRRDVAARLEEIRREHGPIASNRARTCLSGCYAWAFKAGLAEANPVIGTEAPSEERTRDRVIAPPELTAIWRAAGEMGEFGAIVRLLMLTGQRREEVAGLSWNEIDLERGLLVIPAARTKNGREHEVPLARQALALLEGRPAPYLFGRRGRSPFSGFSRAKARLDQKLGDAVAPWVLHDLRRSWVTHAVDVLGIQPHHAEAAINHVSGHKGGVAGIYNRSVYRAPKAAAMQAMADWIEALVEGREPASNVVALGNCA